MPSLPTGRGASIPNRFWVACVGALLLGMGLRIATDSIQPAASSSPGDLGTRLAEQLDAPSRSRTPASYRGLGVWIDAFDFAPAYQVSGGTPSVTPDDVAAFADRGVGTIYLQAARRDDRSGPGLLDEELLGRFLLRAHTEGIHVVAWYLPRFDDVAADVAKTAAMADFEVHGHRFDGIALDIEDVTVVGDPAVRSAALVDLVEAVRAEYPDDALGAIVPPPVQLEVINPDFWPDFPWREIAPNIDVWLPMAYWTTRSHDSGYRDAYRYSEESTRRLIANVGHDVPVHIIGGIGDQTSAEDLMDFRDALDRTGAIGGSIYDWNSMSEDLRSKLPAAVP